MPKQVPDEATLKGRIATRLSRLAQLMPRIDDDPPGRRLASWPRRIDQLADDLLLLRPLDPLAALRGLGLLGDTMVELNNSYEESSGLEVILAKQEALWELYPSFQAALAQGDALGLADRVFALVTEGNLLDDDIPQSLLDALGREGRKTVALRLASYKRTKAGVSWIYTGFVTKILLAEPDVEDTLGLITQLGLEEKVSATMVVERLLSQGVAGPEFLTWVRRLLHKAVHERDNTDSLIRHCVEACEARGQPDVAQIIRREAFPILFDVGLLRDWLDRLPLLQRQPEEARALREVAKLECRSSAMLFLLEWPDVNAAVQLVMQHHDEMVGQSCATFNKAARLIEATAPKAAMLLYRRGALCEYSTGVALVDEEPYLDRCAALWARYWDGSYESHAKFMDRLAYKRNPWR